MGNSFVDYLKKKAQQDIIAPIQRDVVAPVAHAATAVAAPVVHAAQNAVQTVNNDVVKPVQRDILKPIENPMHTLDNIGHGIDSGWQGVNRDVLHPIYRAPQNFENDVAAPVDRFVDKSAIGRGAETVGMGALRAGTGLVQAASGLNDLVQKGMDKLPSKVQTAIKIVDPAEIIGQHLAGNSHSVSKHLTNLGAEEDAANKADGGNKALYEGSQVVTNILPTLLTGGGTAALEGGGEAATEASGELAAKQAATDAAEQEAKQGLVKTAITKSSDASKSAIKRVLNTDIKHPLTAPADDLSTFGSKVASTAADNIVSAKNLGANAAYQAYNAGQDEAAGKHVNPLSQLENLGVYQLGFPLLGAAGSEALKSVTPTLMKAGSKIVSSFGEPAIKAAEDATGISRHNIINDNEAGTLRDYSEYLTKDYKPDVGTINQLIKQARNAGGTAGIDVTSGSAVDITDRIYKYLADRRGFVNAHNSVKEGGYLRIPTGKKDIAPDLSDQQKEYVNDYANMLQGMHDTGDDSNILTKLRKAGGVSVSDYEDLPTSIKNKGGRALDDLASEMGYPDDEALHDAIMAEDDKQAAGVPKTPRDWFDKAREELEGGNASFGASEDYKNLPTKQVSDAASALAAVPDAKPDNELADLQAIPRAQRTTEQKSRLDSLILKGFSDVRDKNFSGDDNAFYNQFIVPEADKSTRSADLAQEIMGQVENDNVPVSEAINNSIKPDAPIVQNDLTDYHDARSELVSIASRNKQPQLLKQFDDATKGMSLADKTAKLKGALNDFRAKGGGLIDKGAKFDQPAADAASGTVDDAMPALPANAPVAKLDEPDFESLAKMEPEPTGELGGQKITASDMGPQTDDNMDADSYAKAFGLSPMQAEKDFAEMRGQALDHKSMTKEELAKLGPQEKLSVKARRELIASDERQATANKVNITPVTDGKLKDRARSAIAQSEGVNQEADSRLTRAVQLGNKMSTHDQGLLYKYDDGASIESLIPEATNKKLFTKAATAYADATDYDLAARRAAGEATLKQKNYVPHQYAVDEKWLDEHGIPENQRIKQGKEVKGFRDTTAKYKSYAQASKETDGLLKPLNSNPIQDLEDYRAGGFMSRRNNLLTAALAKAAPDDIGSLSTLAVGDKRLNQGAGNLPFSVSDDVQKHLKGYRRTDPPGNIFTKVVDKTGKVINSATKKVLFFGTPFHYINEQASFIGKNLLNPKNLAIGEKRFIQGVATKGGYQRLLDRAGEVKLADGSSLLESIRKMGVVLPDDSRLNRASSAFSLTEAEAALRKGLDPNSKQAVDLGQQINHLMGHRNLAVESESPRTHNLLSVGTLAPSWSTTQLGLVKDALTKRGIKGNTAGGYARRAVLGKRALLAGAGIGGSVAITGNLPTGSEALNEAGLTLKNPVPNVELNSHTKSGESQEMVAPTDPLGLAVGLVSDPSHFVQSRLSPALSFATKVATNQNWNGEPLAEGPHDSTYYKQLVENAALNSGLPIGVQNLTNATHNPNNPSIVQGLEQDFGGRLKTNPTDPKYVASQQYYSALSHATDRLTPGSPAMGAFLENFGVTKDPVTGKYLMTPNSEMTVAKSASLNAYPAAQAAANAMAKELQAKGQTVDPFYLLTPAQQKAYNSYETMAPLSSDRTDWQNRNPWYSDFANKQSAFFDSLPPGAADKPVNPIQYPKFDTQTNNDLNTYYALTDSTAKNNFLDAHPNVGQAMNKTFDYSNAVRVARGYQPLKGYPQPTPALAAALATYSTLDKASAKAYAAEHPQIYNFFQLASQYSLNKAAGLNQIQGNDLTPAEVKTINGLGEDIYYNGGLIGENGELVAPTGGSSGGSGGGGYGTNPLANALYYLESEKAPKVVHLHGVGSSGIVKPVTASYHLPQPAAPYTVKKSTISSGKKVKV